MATPKFRPGGYLTPDAFAPTRIVPDGITPIRAYRAWRRYPHSYDARGDTVAGWGHLGLWPTGVPVVNHWTRIVQAGCLTVHTHQAPDARCGCGIHACKDITDVVSRVAQPIDDIVYGQVDLWGKIVELEWGYRAQHAKVVALYATDNQVEQLADAYRVQALPVPVELMRLIGWQHSPSSDWVGFLVPPLED